MKVSEEMNKKVEEEKKQNNETPTGNFDYAKKWLMACIVLFIILIVLVVLLQIFKTGEMWPDVPLATSSNA